MSNSTSSQDQAEAATAAQEQQQQQQQPKPLVLEEDDEFEDFPVDDWSPEETEQASSDNDKLWEESWDDDDDFILDFSAQLKEEIQKVQASKS